MVLDNLWSRRTSNHHNSRYHTVTPQTAKHLILLVSGVSNLSGVVLLDADLFKFLVMLQNETFLVGKMQQADEAKRCRNIVHSLLRVHCFEVVHHGGELEIRARVLVCKIRGRIRRRLKRCRLAAWSASNRNIGCGNMITHLLEVDASPQLFFQPPDINLLCYSCVLHVFWSESS